MGYEVSRQHFYGPTDLYNNGTGISVLKSTLEEAEATYEDFCRSPCGYPFACFIVGPGFEVIKQSGPSMQQVDAAMRAAWNRRYRQRAQRPQEA